MDAQALLAEGWERLPTRLFTAQIGEAWVRMRDGRPEVCVMSAEDAANDYGVMLHGGALMTFADMAFGVGVARSGGDGPIVTVELKLHFVASARPGALLTCAPEVVRKTSSLVFVRGLILADGATVASADGIFKRLDPARYSGLKAG